MVSTEEGVVIEAESGKAKIRVMRHGDCKNCGACPGDDSTLVSVRNTLHALPGQRVAFKMKQGSMLGAAFIVYILPLAAAAAGYAGGWLLSQKTRLAPIPCEIGAVMLGLIGSLILIKHWDQKISNDTQTLPETVEILS